MKLSADRIEEITDKIGSSRILVLGDVMLDRYIHGTVSRISPEAPVPVINIEREYLALGGAANVSVNINELGDSALTLGLVGKDQSADMLREEFSKTGLSAELLITDTSRQTTMKTRIIAETQQVARVDRESSHAIEHTAETEILVAVDRVAENVKAVIISDYGKGVITRSLLERLIPALNKRGLFVAVDPKETHFMNYSDVSLITPNHHEASFAGGTRIVNDETLQVVGHHLMSRLRLGALLITRGKDGMSLFESGRESGRESSNSNDPDSTTTLTHFPTVAQKVFDVTGAGDTVIASFVSAVCAGASLKEAAIISNTAAGIVVGELGASSVSLDDLREALNG